MRSLVLSLLSVLTFSSSALAASYQTTFGSVRDPIQLLSRGGGAHPYSGSNLEPFAFLRGANLDGANLDNANLAEANLAETSLDGANLRAANLDGANLFNANLAETNLAQASMQSANLLGANLEGADLFGTNLTDAHLNGANLSFSQLAFADLTNADLSGANLDEANLVFANLTNADLSGAFLRMTFGLDGFAGGPPRYDASTDFTGTHFDPVAAGWTFVPEPSTAVLMGLGLVGLGLRRQT